MKTCRNYLIHSLLICSVVFAVFLCFGLGDFSARGVFANSGDVLINITGYEKKEEIYFSTDILGRKKFNLGEENDMDVFKSFGGVFGVFFNILFSVAGILMVVLLAVYGTQMIYAQVAGNIANLVNAKKRVIDIAIGVVLLMFSWLILNFVNPELLQPKSYEDVVNYQELIKDGGVPAGRGVIRIEDYEVRLVCVNPYREGIHDKKDVCIYAKNHLWGCKRRIVPYGGINKVIKGKREEREKDTDVCWYDINMVKNG